MKSRDSMIHQTQPIVRSTARVLAILAATVGAQVAWGASNPAAAQLVVDAESLEACEVLRLGDALDVPDWLAFQRAPRLVPDPAGRVYVLPGDATVTLLDAEGGFLRTMGGMGKGPGEFVVIDRIGFVGDTLWLQNWPMLHTSFFDANGTYLGTEADHGPPHTGPATARTSAPLARGRGFYIPATGNISAPRVLLPLLSGNRSGASRDTLAFMFSTTDMSLAGVGTFSYSPTTTPPLYKVDPGGHGIVMAEWAPDRPEAVTVRHFNEYGRVTHESTITAELRPIPRTVRRGFIEEGMKKAEGPYEAAKRMGGKVSGSLRDAVEAGLILPDYYAPIRGMLVTHGGRVWLRENAWENASESDWLVLSPDDEAEFRVRAPEGMAFQAPHGDRVWATGTTEMDVPFIVLYDLVRPGECR